MTHKGPAKIVKTKFSCEGCSYLETKHWTFYGENDDYDSGTKAKCNKVNRPIDSYWDSSDSSPKWCPFLKGD